MFNRVKCIMMPIKPTRKISLLLFFAVISDYANSEISSGKNVNKHSRFELGYANSNHLTEHVINSRVLLDAERVLEATDSNPTSCDNHATYSSLQSCKSDCDNKKNGLKSPELTSDDNVTYKVVLFSSREFTISKDGRLNLVVNEPPSTFDSDSFVLSENGSASVCYPLEPSFLGCDKWGAYPNEVRYFPENLTLRVIAEKTDLNLGQFYVTTVFNEQHFLICIPKRKFELTPLNIAHLVGALISVVALVLALILTQTVKTIKNNVNRLLKCHIITLAITFFIISIRFIVSKKSRPAAFCIATSSLQQLFYLSAFFWVNAHMFDLYVNVRDNLRPMIEDKRNQRKFAYYCLVCFGLPVIIASVALIAELVPIPELQPQFALHCWFAFRSTLAFAYLYGWMALSLAINVCIFFLIVVKFRQLSKDISAANKLIHRQLVKVALKLVIVMGFFWIFKVVVWAGGMKAGVLWYFDVFTHFQGLFVALVYVSQGGLIKRLVDKVKSLCVSTVPSSTSNSVNKTGNTPSPTVSAVTVL